MDLEKLHKAISAERLSCFAVYHSSVIKRDNPTQANRERHEMAIDYWRAHFEAVERERRKVRGY